MQLIKKIEHHRRKQTKDLNCYLTKHVAQVVHKCIKSCPNVLVIMALEAITHPLDYQKIKIKLKEIEADSFSLVKCLNS